MDATWPSSLASLSSCFMQEFDGSDSGARPDEAISWGKIRVDCKPVKVPSAGIGMVLPLLAIAPCLFLPSLVFCLLPCASLEADEWRHAAAADVAGSRDAW